MNDHTDLKERLIALTDDTCDEAAARIAELEAQIAAQAGQVVWYQYRMRADWLQNWMAWEDCSEASYYKFLKHPLIHNLHYEVRALCIATPAAPANEIAIVSAALEAAVIAVGGRAVTDEIFVETAVDAIRAIDKQSILDGMRK